MSPHDPNLAPSSESSREFPVVLRPAREGDGGRIVEIRNRLEPDLPRFTLERLREERAAGEGHRRGEALVALTDERVAGYGAFSPAWWSGEPTVFSVEIYVDPDCTRRGVGGRLLELLLSRAAAAGATRVLSWLREDDASARRFAARHGFSDTGQVIQEYRLALQEARADTHPGLEERLEREGLRFASLAELPLEDESFLRALQRVWADAGEAPLDPEELACSFAAWRREVLDAPGLTPDTHWVAIDGVTPVGLTFLRRLSDTAAENDYTGVAATHRGRGIAAALKLRAIRSARERGMEWFYTSTEVGNQPMIALNTRLGYCPGARRLEAAREVTG